MRYFLFFTLLFSNPHLALSVETTLLGMGNTVEHMNRHLLLYGMGINVGQIMPKIGLLNYQHHVIYTTNNANKKTLYFLVPSVDEPISTKNILDVYNKTSHTNHRIIFVSTDSVHTLARFKQFYNLDKAIFLTDARTHSYGLRTGTLIRDWGELTRAIIVTNENNKVISIQAVKNLLDLPCIVKALKLM